MESLTHGSELHFEDGLTVNLVAFTLTFRHLHVKPGP